MKLLFFILILCILGSSHSFYSQDKQVVFGKITVENGLSQNSVISIVQDRLGVLWLATQEGLNRYDGVEFELFKEYFDDITRPDYSQLGKLLVDKNDNLWLITANGILKKYHLHDYSIKVFQNVPSANCLYQDGNNNLIIGTLKDGLYQIDIDKSNVTKIASLGNSVDFDAILAITQDRQGWYWLATTKGLFTADNLQTDFRRVSIKGHNDEISVNSLISDKSGNLWAGTYQYGPLVKYASQETFEQFKPSVQGQATPDLSKLYILSIMVDSQQRIWFGTYGDGLFLISEDGSVRSFKFQKNNPNSISYNDILCLYEDSNHVIWAGTDGGGVSFYDDKLHKFSSYTNVDVPENVHVNVIRSILQDSEESLWLGTSGYGLTKYSPNGNKKWHTLSTENSGLNGNRIMCLLEDNEKNIWIGTQGDGLNILNKTTGIVENFHNNRKPNSLSSHTIWTMFKDSKNRYWIGTRDMGLVQFDKDNGIIAYYNSENSALHTNSVNVIVEENSDILWIGTENHGLSRFEINEGSFTPFDQNSGLGSPYIKSLYYEQGYLWIGTKGGGLNVLEIQSGEIKRYTTQEGLPNNVVYTILPDDDGNLWLSTNRGICKFIPPVDPISLDDPVSIVSYDNYDGLQGLEFNTGASFKDRSGNLYFGGVNGYNWFNPNRISVNNKTSKSIINRFEVNGTPLQPDTVIHRKNTIDLAYHQNDISFSFSNLNFGMPYRNSYRYKLIGHEEDWVTSGFRNYVNYTNLEPGKYQFQVLGANYDGVFHHQPTVLLVNIRPPWWSSSWAYVGYSLLFFSIIVGTYKLQHHRWKLKTQIELEHKEAEKFRELHELETRLYTNITHEFRTPLTVILGLANKCREYLQKRNASQLTHALITIKSNSNRLLNLVNQMMDLSRLQSNVHIHNPSSGDLVRFLRNQVSLFQSHAELKDLEIVLKSDLDRLIMEYDRECLQKTISNLLSNAIKFSSSGIITVSVEVEKGLEIAVVKVCDQGIGISKSDLPYVFDRFYTTIENGNRQGSGIGLALVKELVDKMQGTIEISSDLGAGTEVTVSLPLRFNNNSELGMLSVNPKSLGDDVDNFDPDLVDKEIVLLIEDNNDLLDYLTSCLKHRFKILETTNGDMGIAYALKYVPDIVISDIMMPLKDGYEVCRSLKDDPRTSHIPIVLLTAKTETRDKIKGIKSGADAYLVKPFNEEELMVQIEGLIQTRKKLQSVFQGPFSIDSYTSAYPETEANFLNKLNSIISDQLNNSDLNVSYLCDKLYMSRTQLHRKIKALTDRSITAYIRSVRLNIAKKLISTTNNLTIQQIAYDTGFSDPSYFHRAFVKEFGSNPSSFRR